MTAPYTTILIGSTAAKKLGIDLGRDPRDRDYFSNDPAVVGDVHWHDEFDELWEPGTVRTATLDELTTLKYSHSFWELRNGSWNKHMRDLATLRGAGGKVDEHMFEVLYSLWENKHGKKLIDLNMDRTEFFGDRVPRTYVHDSIHETVSHPNRPIYESCLKDGHEVAMDMTKVWSMPHDRIVAMFKEEICTIALERKVIPSEYLASPGASYLWAYRRMVTSLTKGKSARFLVDNYREFRTPPKGYVDRHLSNRHLLVPFHPVGDTP